MPRQAIAGARPAGCAAALASVTEALRDIAVAGVLMTAVFLPLFRMVRRR